MTSPTSSLGPERRDPRFGRSWGGEPPQLLVSPSAAPPIRDGLGDAAAIIPIGL